MSSSTSCSPIHFIWIGGLISDKQITLSASGPISCSGLYPDRKIILWLSENSLIAGKEIFGLYTNIELKSIEGFIRGDYDGGLQHLVGPYFDYVEKLFDLMGQIEKDKPEKNSHRFVMQKDLMSIAILFEYGGYFFDTTTVFITGDSLKDYVTPKMPCTVDLDAKVWCEDFEELNSPFCWLDVWAMYAPTPEHAFLSEGFRLLLSRWEENYSMRPLNKLSVDEQKSLSSETGSTVMHAFQTLYLKENPKDFLWETTKTSSASLQIKELDMQKHFASSWRSASDDYPAPEQATEKGTFVFAPSGDLSSAGAAMGAGAGAGAASGSSFTDPR